MTETSASARARLITTRRGAWVDESLFPEARRECEEIVERVVRDSRDDGIVEMLRGERKRLDDYPIGDRLRRRSWYGSPYLGGVDRWDRNRAALGILAEKLEEYERPEERDAWRLAAVEAFENADTCGSCARTLAPGEPAHFGGEVYVGFPPLRWEGHANPRLCQPHYERTVLCASCAPGWLSAEREDVVTQLCGHCGRPMVHRLEPSEMGRTFCSKPCQRGYRARLREEERAEKLKELEKVCEVCEVCGQGFTATRRDAKTCSPRCKQKAYRLRKREAGRNR